MSVRDILNFRRIDDRLTTSGQPTARQFAMLAELGVRHVVNLGMPDHPRAVADEPVILAALGIGYTAIPVPFDAPEESHYQAFRQAMIEHGNAPLHVHCIVNARVTAFLTRYRREVLGMDDATARAPMDSVWRPGGAWAAFLGDPMGVDRDHHFAGRDYPLPDEVDQ